MIKTIYRVCITLTLITMLSGCTANRAAANKGLIFGEDINNKPLDGMERAYKGSMPSLPGDNAESIQFERKNASDSERAYGLCSVIRGIDGVEDSTAVINGHTAIVGVTMSGEPGNSAIVNLKKKIEKCVREYDNTITRVAITAAPELYERILNISGSNARQNPPLENEIFPVTPSF